LGAQILAKSCPARCSDSGFRSVEGAEIWVNDLFSECWSLSALTFESNSQLDRIGAFAFSECSSLKSIRIPSSVQIVDGTTFIDSEISEIAVAEGNPCFSISHDFLLDFDGISVIRYFGSDSNIQIRCAVERLCNSSLCKSDSLSTLTFESNSQLGRIGAYAFSECLSLRSICMPSSITILCESCFSKCWAL
jgi:hypothetical protein